MVVTVVQWFCLDSFRGVLCETFQVVTKALVSQRRGLHLGAILGQIQACMSQVRFTSAGILSDI